MPRRLYAIYQPPWHEHRVLARHVPTSACVLSNECPFIYELRIRSILSFTKKNGSMKNSEWMRAMYRHTTLFVASASLRCPSPPSTHRPQGMEISRPTSAKPLTQLSAPSKRRGSGEPEPPSLQARKVCLCEAARPGLFCLWRMLVGRCDCDETVARLAK